MLWSKILSKFMYKILFLARWHQFSAHYCEVKYVICTQPILTHRYSWIPNNDVRIPLYNVCSNRYNEPYFCEVSRLFARLTWYANIAFFMLINIMTKVKYRMNSKKNQFRRVWCAPRWFNWMRYAFEHGMRCKIEYKHYFCTKHKTNFPSRFIISSCIFLLLFQFYCSEKKNMCLTTNVQSDYEHLLDKRKNIKKP